MIRVRMEAEYDGTDYSGWQRQDNALAVQQVIEDTLEKLTGERVSVTGASRTDAGVHARGQVVHFDTSSAIPPERYHFALNSHLPPDIRIRSSCAVSPDFHARFCASGKEYIYRFSCGPVAPAIGRQYMWHIPRLLDVAAMREAARVIIGTHDFSAFMAAGGSAKTFTRTMYEADVRESRGVVEFRVAGSGFLYNMVRILAGTLAYIGIGKLMPTCMSEALAAGNRLLLGPTAPACGLTLERVFYSR